MHFNTIKQVRQHLLSWAPYVIIGLIAIMLPPFGGAYIQGMIAKVLIFGIFAMSLNLLLGYSGLFSLGHAAFFGVGGYTAGLLITRYGVTSFWAILFATLLVAVIFAAILGIIALRLRGVYFLLVTMAFGELLYGIAVKWRNMTGGSDGLAGISYPELGLPGITMNATSYYYLVLVVAIVCFFLMYKVASSPFGQALQGIREDGGRMQALGYNIWLHQYIIYIVAGVFAAIAGLLFAHENRFISPGHLGLTNSVFVMLMVIIGSTNTVFGPILGAAVIVLLEHFIGIAIPARWPLILGCVFVLSVMFFRAGIGIYLADLWNKTRLKYSHGSNKD
jgi:branched-chain amino acid transport system permease protein